MHVSFDPDAITSGGKANVIVKYTSDDPVTLFLNGWDPAEFTISPTSFDLPAAPAERTTPPPTLQVTIVRKAASTNCGVHFVLGSLDDDFAFVGVT